MNNTSKQKKNDNSGRLVGWLVSYGLDEMGFSYKLVTGRTFVAQEAGDKVRTLAIDDSSLSSPHLALKATSKHTLFAQDIFSNSGSYLQRGDMAERPITGQVELKHGDWIRVGDNARFQVCLINGQSK